MSGHLPAWPSQMGDFRERRHQHPVHTLFRVLLAADRDHRRRLPRPGGPSGEALHRAGRDLGDRPGCRTAACTSASPRRRKASAHWRRARRPRPCTLRRSTRRTASSSPAGRPTPTSRGTSCGASACSPITADSRWRCSSTPATSGVWTTPRSRRSTSPPVRWTARSARATATTSISRARPRSSWSTTRSVTWWPRSARRSVPSPSRAWRPPASGFARIWPGASCAPIARRAPG